MAKQNALQKVIRKVIPVIDGIIEKVKKTDKRLLLMIAASVVLLIVILALIIHSVGKNKADNNEVPSDSYNYIVEEDTTDAVDTNSVIAVGAGVYTVDTGSESDLNMRPTAGKEYGAMATIPNGKKVEVMFVDDSGDISWGYVEYNGKRGWVAMDYLVAIP